MQMMILYSFFSQFAILLTNQLIVNSYTIVGQSFPMTVIYAFADLKELKVVLNGFFVFFDVVIQHSDRIVRSSFISDLTSPSTAKSKHLIILQSSQSSYINSIIDFFRLNWIADCWCIFAVGFIESCRFAFAIVNMSRGSVKEQRQLNSMRLWGSHWFIISGFVETPHLILLSQWTAYFKGAVQSGLV